MNTPVISIIIPTYKPEDYLWECLDSIYSQAIELTQLELIIVLNGCCTPYDKNIEKYLSTKSKKIKVKLIKTNIPGVSNARNIGIKESCGEYICFIDDDDWISANYFSNLISVATDDCSVVVSNVKNYFESTDNFCDDYITKAFMRNINKQDIGLLSARHFMSSACCKIINKECIGSILFNSQFKRGEDSLFMATISNKLIKLKLASEDTVYYRRVRIGSASRSSIPLRDAVVYRINLSKAYIKVYLTDIRHYNILFFFTRIAALIRALVNDIMNRCIKQVGVFCNK